MSTTAFHPLPCQQFPGMDSVSITGRTYHRIFDITDHNHSLHWYLYNTAECKHQGNRLQLPQNWISSVEKDLRQVNPYRDYLRIFGSWPEHMSTVLKLSDVSANGDFAAVLHPADSNMIQP